MSLTNAEKKEIREQLNDRDKYILEMISSTRKMHALQFQNLTSKIDELIVEVKVTRNDASADRLILKQELENYKSKMRYWELFMEWKHLPFWTFMSLFAVVSRTEIKLLLDTLLKKFTGQ